MKLTDGVKLKGRGVEIPDCGRSDLPVYFKELGFTVGVEIGVFRAEFTEILAQSGMQIYGIDPWLAYPGYPYRGVKDQQKEFDKAYQQSVAKLAPYPNVTLIRKTSMEAVKDFADNSIDFVYIDGNHDFMYVAEDICSWVKKVKPGGFVTGHDYIYANAKNFHVHYVVDCYVESHAIKNLWILGRKHKLSKHEVRDEWRSWMFRKESDD